MNNTPYAVGHNESENLYWVEDCDGETVCDLYFKNSDDTYHRFANAKEHAEFIVSSCNSNRGYQQGWNEAYDKCSARYESGYHVIGENAK
jgi:hypothetical protein